MEKAKRELKKVEVTVATHNTSDKIKEKLASMNDKELTEYFQQGLAKGGFDPTIIRRATKVSKHFIKIRGANENGTAVLRKLNWKEALEGTELIDQTYGITLDGVPKYDIDFERDTMEEIKTKIESANHGCIKIERVKPLMNRPKNPEAPTHSIVFFTKKLDEANECILSGIKIGSRCYQPHKYSPQFQIKQCFNCQGFGYKSEVCTKETKCAYCAGNHDTRKCKSTIKKCANCNDEHGAFDNTENNTLKNKGRNKPPSTHRDNASA